MRRPLVRVLTALLATAAACAAAELLYRWLRVPGLSPTTHPGYVVHDPELGWAYRPNARARHRSAEFDVAVAINAQGFRGPDWPLRDGRPLVLVLGDSLVFGWGVEEHEGLCGVLRARCPEWDVRGAGVSGQAPDQQLLLLRRLRHLAPAVVVCISCVNDGYEVATDFVYGLHKPRFVDGGDGLTLASTPGAQPFGRGASLLLRAIDKLVWRQRFTRGAPAEDWGLVRALYRTMQQENPGSRFVIATAHRKLPELAHAGGLHHVDLESVLDPLAGAWWFPIDTHWNAAGHARVAGAIATAVRNALEQR